MHFNSKSHPFFRQCIHIKWGDKKYHKLSAGERRIQIKKSLNRFTEHKKTSNNNNIHFVWLIKIFLLSRREKFILYRPFFKFIVHHFSMCIYACLHNFTISRALALFLYIAQRCCGYVLWKNKLATFIFLHIIAHKSTCAVFQQQVVDLPRLIHTKNNTGKNDLIFNFISYWLTRCCAVSVEIYRDFIIYVCAMGRFYSFKNDFHNMVVFRIYWTTCRTGHFYRTARVIFKMLSSNFSRNE